MNTHLQHIQVASLSLSPVYISFLSLLVICCRSYQAQPALPRDDPISGEYWGHGRKPCIVEPVRILSKKPPISFLKRSQEEEEAAPRPDLVSKSYQRGIVYKAGASRVQCKSLGAAAPWLHEAAGMGQKWKRAVSAVTVWLNT